LDNRTVLSQNISNEDNHALYDSGTNTLTLNYTFNITEETVYITENGVTNEYLKKTYNSVQYKAICMLIELNAATVTNANTYSYCKAYTYTYSHAYFNTYTYTRTNTFAIGTTVTRSFPCIFRFSRTDKNREAYTHESPRRNTRAQE
jgi:hypothetical protein